MLQRTALLFALLAAAVSTSSAGAQGFGIVRVATGVARPVFATGLPFDGSRVFVLEQHTGNIRILRLPDRTLLPTAFLTVPGVSTGNEQGLLGLAFHPRYKLTGLFYVYYTGAGGTSFVVRYQVSADPNLADATSATPVLSFSQPASNHNGGWIGFGPDQYLYVSSGDGGDGNDIGTGHTPGIGNAQDLTDNLLGKLLRIDVDGDDFPADAARNYAIPPSNPFVGVAGDDEIWSYGLRNPWRASFDRTTGDLYIGDVGQDFCEEVDVQPAASSGGENYGWRLREGTIATPTGGVGGTLPGAIDPIFDYPHGDTAAQNPCSDPGGDFVGISVSGGAVYRGPIASLVGRYFFADYLTDGHLWSLRWDGSDPSLFDGTNYTELTDHAGDPSFTPDVGSLDRVSGFGEDRLGNLYILDLSDGEVFMLPEPSVGALQAAAGIFLALLARLRGVGGR